MPTPKINKEAFDALPPEDQAEVTKLLGKLNDVAQANPLISYFPHGKQKELHELTASIRAFFGGNRSGKTTAGLVDDLIQAVDREVLPAHLLPYKRWEPPFHCRVVVPDFEHTLNVVLLQKVRDWVPRGQLKGGSFETAYSNKSHILNFANGSWGLLHEPVTGWVYAA